MTIARKLGANRRNALKCTVATGGRGDVPVLGNATWITLDQSASFLLGLHHPVAPIADRDA